MLRNCLSAVFACGLFTAALVGAPSHVDAQDITADRAGRTGLRPGNGNGNGNGNGRRPRTEAPEISVQGAPAALAVVLGSVAILLGRRRRKPV